MSDIEKSSNMFYPKCILVNKTDRVEKMKEYKKFLGELEDLKHKDIPNYKISALNNSGIQYVFTSTYITLIFKLELEQIYLYNSQKMSRKQ